MMPWTAVVPVKRYWWAKSRLDLPDRARHDLARALALDQLDTLASCPQVGLVVVVTDEPSLLSGPLRGGVATVREDSTSRNPADLNRALRRARDWLHGAGRAAAPAVVVPTDLPALTSGVLSVVLRAASAGAGGFVPDRSGRGTTLLLAETARGLHPAYGRDSAADHRALGFEELAGVDVRARHDVDTLEDLVGALRLGTGRRTHALADALSRRSVREDDLHRKALGEAHCGHPLHQSAGVE